MILFYDSIKTKDGFCGLAWSSKGLAGLTLPLRKKSRIKPTLESQLTHFKDLRLIEDKVSLRLIHLLQDALQGRYFKIPPLDLGQLTKFQKKVLNTTIQIPRGETRAYSFIARHVHSPRSARAVGNALNRNPIPLFIPCHRVIMKNSTLGGFGGNIKMKLKLLNRERIISKK